MWRVITQLQRVTIVTRRQHHLSTTSSTIIVPSIGVIATLRSRYHLVATTQHHHRYASTTVSSSSSSSSSFDQGELALSEEQLYLVNNALEGTPTFLEGFSGSGKTRALLATYLRLTQLPSPTRERKAVLFLAPTDTMSREFSKQFVHRAGLLHQREPLQMSFNSFARYILDAQAYLAANPNPYSPTLSSRAAAASSTASSTSASLSSTSPSSLVALSSTMTRPLPFYFPYRSNVINYVDLRARVAQDWDLLAIPDSVCSHLAPFQSRVSMVSNSFARLLDMHDEVEHLLHKARARLAESKTNTSDSLTSSITKASDLVKQIGVMEAYLRFVSLPGVDSTTVSKLTALEAASALKNNTLLRQAMCDTFSHILVDDLQQVQLPHYIMLRNLIDPNMAASPASTEPSVGSESSTSANVAEAPPPSSSVPTTQDTLAPPLPPSRAQAPCLIVAGDSYQPQAWSCGHDIMQRMCQDFPNLARLYLRQQHRSNIEILYSALAPAIDSRIWRQLPTPPERPTATSLSTRRSNDADSSASSSTSTSTQQRLVFQAPNRLSNAAVYQLVHCQSRPNEIDLIAQDIYAKWSRGPERQYSIGILVRSSDSVSEVTKQLARNELVSRSIDAVSMPQQPGVHFVISMLKAIVDPTDDRALLGLLNPLSKRGTAKFVRRYAVPDREFQEALRLHLRHQVPFIDILRAKVDPLSVIGPTASTTTTTPTTTPTTTTTPPSTEAAAIASSVPNATFNSEQAFAYWAKSKHPELTRVAWLLLTDLQELSANLDNKSVGSVLSSMLVRIGAFDAPTQATITDHNSSMATTAATTAATNTDRCEDLLHLLRWIQINKLEDSSVVAMLRAYKRAVTADQDELYFVPSSASSASTIAASSSSSSTTESSPDDIKFKSRLTVTTINQAKENGLEFDVVYMPFTCGSSYPHRKYPCLRLPEEVELSSAAHLAQEKAIFLAGVTRAKKHVIFSSSGTGKVSPFVKDALARMQHPTSYAQPFDIDMSYVISTIRLASYNLTVKRRRYSPLTAREVKRIPISWAMMSTLLGCPLSFCLKYVFRRDHAVKGSALYGRVLHRAAQIYAQAQVTQSTEGEDIKDGGSSFTLPAAIAETAKLEYQRLLREERGNDPISAASMAFSRVERNENNASATGKKKKAVLEVKIESELETETESTEADDESQELGEMPSSSVSGLMDLLVSEAADGKATGEQVAATLVNRAKRVQQSIERHSERKQRRSSKAAVPPSDSDDEAASLASGGDSGSGSAASTPSTRRIALQALGIDDSMLNTNEGTAGDGGSNGGSGHETWLPTLSDSVGPVLVEQDFAIEVPLSANEVIAYIGSWDRVDRTAEGYAVVELKSSDAGAFRPEAVVQLALYMYAFEKMYHIRPTKGVLESIASGKQRVITMSDELMQDCENLIVAAMMLLQSNTFPATPSVEQCMHCAFRTSCSMAEK